MDQRQAGWILAAGGGLIALGSLMPWVTVSTAFGSVSASGMEGDGVFTLVAGIVLGVLGVLYGTGSQTPSMVVKVAAYVVLGVVAWVWFTDIRTVDEALDTSVSEVATGGIGIGLWVLIVGVCVALLGAIGLPTAGGEVTDAIEGEE